MSELRILILVVPPKFRLPAPPLRSARTDTLRTSRARAATVDDGGAILITGAVNWRGLWRFYWVSDGTPLAMACLVLTDSEDAQRLDERGAIRRSVVVTVSNLYSSTKSPVFFARGGVSHVYQSVQQFGVLAFPTLECAVVVIEQCEHIRWRHWSRKR